LALPNRPAPRSPADLVDHDWLGGEVQGSGLLLLDQKGGEHRVKVKTKVQCNNVLPLRQFALAGLGIALQPEGEISDDLAHGRLLELLPDYRSPMMEIHAITPQREIPEKVRRVIEALRSYFGAL
ncbi:LysR substrate-binding domain-containing protein, partial [Aeromonas cavernicola]